MVAVAGVEGGNHDVDVDETLETFVPFIPWNISISLLRSTSTLLYSGRGRRN